MGRNRFSNEQTTGKLREAEILLAKGRDASQVSRAFVITDQLSTTSGAMITVD